MCEIFTIRTIGYTSDNNIQFRGYCIEDIINIKENINISDKYLRSIINDLLNLSPIEEVITTEGILRFALEDGRYPRSELYQKFTQKYNIHGKQMDIINQYNSQIRINMNNFTKYEINKENRLNLEFNNINSKLSKLEIENSKSNKNIELLLNKVDELEKNNKLLFDSNKLLNEKVRNCEIEIHYLKSTIQNKNIKYNYEEIRNRNKKLNSDFKKVYRLISKKY